MVLECQEIHPGPRWEPDRGILMDLAWPEPIPAEEAGGIPSFLAGAKMAGFDGFEVRITKQKFLQNQRIS